MSVALALKKNRQIILAADSQHNFGSSTPARGNILESKLRKFGNAYIATTGWGLYRDILEHYENENPNISLDSKKAIFSFFIQLWKDLHQRYSFVNDQSDDHNTPFGDLDSAFLIVANGQIFHVSGNMNVTEFHHFHAIGSGSAYALGALHVLYDMDMDAREMAEKCLGSAITYNIYCGAPIDVVELPA